MSNLGVLGGLFPLGRKRALLQFNRLNGTFITAHMDFHGEQDPEKLNNTHFVYAWGEFDAENDRVVGKYPNYEIVPKKSLPPEVYEASLNTLAAVKITKVYPLAKQVTVLAESLATIQTALGVDLPELTEMLGYIRTVLKTNNNRKEFYRESPDYEYISTEEELRRLSELHEGGVTEAMGGARTDPIRIF